MAYDPDLQPILDDIYARLDAAEARLDALETSPPAPEPEPEPELPVVTITRAGTYYNLDSDVILRLDGEFNKNLRILNERPGANLVIQGAWHIWDKALTGKGEHMMLKLGGAPFGDVMLDKLSAEGDGLTEGVQVTTRIETLTFDDVYIGPIYGGLDTKIAPHSGWGVAPNHADYLQVYGEGAIGHVIFDNTWFDGQHGGGNKIIQDDRGIERITTRNGCRFTVAQGEPDDQGYYGGAPSGPFVGLRDGIPWDDDGTSTCLSNRWFPQTDTWRHWIGPMTPA